MQPEIIVPAIVFLLPALLVFIHKHFRYKEKLLEAQGGGQKLLAAESTVSEKRLLELEERVQNLESIIVAMDTDLAALPGRAPRDEIHRLRGAVPALPAAPAALLPGESSKP